MSAKYLNKKKKPYLLLALIMAVAAVVIFMITVKTTEEPATADPAQVEQAKQTQPEEVLQTSVTLVELPINLGEGLVITNISSYAGLYLEDGTDEIVSNILMLELENQSELDLQLAKITLDFQDASANFMVSNLPAGKKAVLLEQSRMEYTSQTLEGATAENTVFLPGFEMHSDTLQITALDGVINVKNISDSDIASDIFIYYKNVVGDVYYGGITYRIRIEGGLKADEIRQVMTQHYFADGSQILMVSYAD